MSARQAARPSDENGSTEPEMPMHLRRFAFKTFASDLARLCLERVTILDLKSWRIWKHALAT